VPRIDSATTHAVEDGSALFFRGVDLNASVRFTFASWRSHVMTISPQFPQCLLLLLFATVCSFELCSNAWLVFLGCDVWLC
jgi:hypothetical protein